MTSPQPADAADEILLALGRLRGRRGPRPTDGGPGRMRLLMAVAAASAPLSVSEIADVIAVDQPRASRLVQQSVDLDLVRREADPADARRTQIVLTEAGTALIDGFREKRRTALNTALAEFDESERTELVRLLSKLAEAWPHA
ncbi:DNA-binding MarR family transcriptional regulator [Microbacterium halimionae]|uniref:DNA-binding MarR family transcriptional regulator n=1 Tax=Microbacterium halimionae TaxID=1526413 RepID=A0A7W3JQ50_9MICO|nr:MarR family transcriptional regulator [Microbacterium halimionae]MBA8816969.1 DNA-binding MarR family transcriptional regulator [Microbacterium halimionae]NII94492.1 DNA-binding MarR family transcriptional regulator [Microbacterium halimionae]